MNIQMLRKFCRCNYVSKIRWAHTLANVEPEIEQLQKQDAKVIKGKLGVTIAAVENYSPVSHISVVFKAGSVYENGHNLGISHCLRNCAVLSTRNRSAFSITRNLESIGAKIRTTSTREHVIYTLECPRDEIDSALELLVDVSTQQAFKPWEVNDATYRMHVDLAILQNHPEVVLMEALHKAAFRGGLSNSLYSLPFMIGKHNSEMLHSFVEDNFTSPRTSVIGLGISLDHLQERVNKLIDTSKSISGAEVKSKFSGGEVRVETDIPLVHAAIVAEGSGLTNPKEMLSLGVLQCLLGTGAHHKFSTSKSSRLGEAAAKCTENPFCVSSININYSENGLFGVYVAGQPEEMHELVKSIVAQMRDVTKNISESSVEIAKHKLKAKLLLERANSKDLLSAMAVEVSLSGQIQSTKDLEKSIDQLKASDITAIAAKVMKTKPAMAAVGRLHSTPHLDEII